MDGWIRIAIGVLAAYLIIKVGIAMMRGMIQPVPEPPPPGELRKVSVRYRCSICGAELKMTLAADEDPEPPRHCQDEMDLIAPIE